MASAGRGESVAQSSRTSASGASTAVAPRSRARDAISQPSGVPAYSSPIAAHTISAGERNASAITFGPSTTVIRFRAR